MEYRVRSYRIDDEVAEAISKLKPESLNQYLRRTLLTNPKTPCAKCGSEAAETVQLCNLCGHDEPLITHA